MQAVPLKWVPWLYFKMAPLTSTFHTICLLSHAWENEDTSFRAGPARPSPAAGAQTGALCLGRGCEQARSLVTWSILSTQHAWAMVTCSIVSNTDILISLIFRQLY